VISQSSNVSGRCGLTNVSCSKTNGSMECLRILMQWEQRGGQVVFRSHRWCLYPNPPPHALPMESRESRRGTSFHCRWSKHGLTKHNDLHFPTPNKTERHTRATGMHGPVHMQQPSWPEAPCTPPQKWMDGQSCPRNVPSARIGRLSD
jgi:hypothetical protein